MSIYYDLSDCISFVFCVFFPEGIDHFIVKQYLLPAKLVLYFRLSIPDLRLNYPSEIGPNTLRVFGATSESARLKTDGRKIE